MIKSAIRRTLLVAAGTFALVSLLTAVRPPVWVNWQVRMIAGIVVGEFGFGLALLPLCMGVVAWFLRRGHPSIAAVTIGMCATAFMLMVKPTLQAVRLGRDLPAQLTMAFGPIYMDRPPFSIVTMLANRPETVAIETMKYSDSLKLDFYRAAVRGPAPCIISIHGGGWSGGDRTESAAIQQFNAWLARHGCAVASIDYRLAPMAKWPAQRGDVLAAMAYLRAHAQSLGIDPARFVLLGRSAGGQLAEAAGYFAHDPGIRGVIAIYGPADLGLSWETTSPHDSFQQRRILEQFLGGTPGAARAAYDSASGALLAGADSPPTLLLHGSLDTIVPADQSELMAEKLAKLGVRHALVSIPWGTHGFDYVSMNSPGGQITAYAIDWFVSTVTR